ncbi:hypothetical protein NIES267_33940 [Calothrix parasitica NIES-267]|uniref:Uncharacterized protein n=1 Tax=Calothrix parasitica NIES-267 TaxID=1973488 RepID=A0A1Z4LRL8_9CYAN|nr:hypothetical protein NIES267_33940 [Calothrix parasitica NIES-267]
MEILVNDYNTSLNSILIRLDEPIDDVINYKAKELFLAFDKSFDLKGFIDKQIADNMSNESILKLPEWNQLRELSLVIQRDFNIHSEVKKKILKVVYSSSQLNRIHPSP